MDDDQGDIGQADQQRAVTVLGLAEADQGVTMSLVVVTLVPPAAEGVAGGRDSSGCAAGEQSKKDAVFPERN